MATTLSLNLPLQGQPGDEFEFDAVTNNTQYRIEVTPSLPTLGIGVWGPNNPSLGKAKNKPGQNYVERTLPAGRYRITINNATGPFTIKVSKNSWFHKVFGWSDIFRPSPLLSPAIDVLKRKVED